MRKKSPSRDCVCCKVHNWTCYILDRISTVHNNDAQMFVALLREYKKTALCKGSAETVFTQTPIRTLYYTWQNLYNPTFLHLIAHYPSHLLYGT